MLQKFLDMVIDRRSSLLLALAVGIVLNILLPPPALAIEPPDPGELDELQRIGKLQSRISFARGLDNYRVDSFVAKRAIFKQARAVLKKMGLSVAEIDRQAPLPAPPPNWQGMPSTGNVKVLAVLIEFNDYAHANSRDFIHSNLFGTGDATRAPYESLVTYYNRASYDQLDLGNGTTLGWYRTSYDRSSVPQTRTGRETLIKQVLNHYNSEGHDFSQYDNDGNGIIDYFVVIWTGPDNGWGNFWWGYQTSFSDTTYSLDGVRLGKYSWQWEARPEGGTFTPIVVIHETGHALGLPDYYDYDSSVGPDGGVGRLDMMDGNKGDHNCFSKWMLDWLSPTVVASGTQAITLDATGTSQDCVVIWPNVTTGDLFSEFFVVQNRHRVGNDNAANMPGDGMLIWHVDASLDSTAKDFAYDNSFTSHKLLRLMEADGLEEIETGDGIADSEDYYVAGKAFGPATTPSSRKYDGTASGVAATDFSSAGPQMSATFSIGEPTPDSAGPLAFGVVYSDGSKRSGTANWSSTYNPWYRRYEVTINGESYYYLDYTTAVTPAGDVRFCRTSSVSGKLLVYCYDANGNAATSRFGFATFKHQ